MTTAVHGHLTRLRTLGRGASGAVVSLAADDASGELFAVKSAGGSGAAALRREQRVLSGLCSPHVVPCTGSSDGGDGSFHLFLEFAPGGSLADEVARNGGRLEECAIRAYAADVLRGLEYLHGKSLVHGDVKGRNVVVGADGRAKLADFGCARSVGSVQPIGGTPAFMAPEVARGEEQGPAADVWALGCTVIEMASGHAPWSDMDDVIAAVHRIGYTDAVPNVPGRLSPEAKDFLDRCLTRNPRDRSTAAQLLEHTFVALAGRDVKPEEAKAKWVSPKSTLDAAFWELESDDESDQISESPAEKIAALAGPVSSWPDWDSEQGWIQVHSEHSGAGDSSSAMQVSGVDCEASDAGMVPVEEIAAGSEELEAEVEELFGVHVGRDDLVGNNVGAVHASIEQDSHLSLHLGSDKFSCLFVCNGINSSRILFSTNICCAALFCVSKNGKRIFNGERLLYSHTNKYAVEEPNLH